MRRVLIALWLGLGLCGAALAQHPLCDGGNRFFKSEYTATEDPDNIYGRNARYNGDSIDLFVDVYTPAGDTATARPLVIFAHGGSFLGGTKDQSEITPFAEELAARGYVTASISYRLDNILNFSGNDALIAAVVRAVQDGKAVVRWFRRSVVEQGNPWGIDTNHIYVGGSSAGAVLSLHMQYADSEQKFKNLPALSDTSLIQQLGGLEGQSGNPGYSSETHGVINLCGAVADSTWIDVDKPVISLHGTDDNTVPYAVGAYSDPAGGAFFNVPLYGSEIINRVANRNGYFSRLLTWQGAGHVPYVNSSDPAAYRTEAVNFIVANLYEHVCQAPAPSNRRMAEAAEAISVSPNPASTRLSVELPAPPPAGTLELIDLNGRAVHSGEIRGALTEIDVSGLSAGLYTLRARTPRGVQLRRVVVR